MQHITDDVVMLKKTGAILARLGFEKNPEIFPHLFEKKHSDYLECISFDFGMNRGFDGCDIKSYLYCSDIEQKYKSAFPKKDLTKSSGPVRSLVFYEKFLENIENTEETLQTLNEYFAEHERLFREKADHLLDKHFFYELVSSEEKLVDVCEGRQVLFDKTFLRRPCFRIILAGKVEENVEKVFKEEMSLLAYLNHKEDLREFYSNLELKNK